MSFKQYVVTLSGSAERLSTALSLTSPTPGLRHISLQPGAAGTNPIYVGDANVSASNYAVRLAAPSGSVPPAPYIIEGYESGPIRLSDFYVIGTATEVLHIGVVEY
jgi:hypothetical protein